MRLQLEVPDSQRDSGGTGVMPSKQQVQACVLHRHLRLGLGLGFGVFSNRKIQASGNPNQNRGGGGGRKGGVTL